MYRRNEVFTFSVKEEEDIKLVLEIKKRVKKGGSNFSDIIVGLIKANYDEVLKKADTPRLYDWNLDDYNE